MTDIASAGAFPVGEYLAIFRRQKWHMLIVGAAIVTASAAFVAYWPPTYRSSATIMIEKTDVPADLVKSATTVLADERVRAIQQRITTSQNLTIIIEKLDLYAAERGSLAMSQIVDKMRSNIGLSIISADTSSKGRDAQVAIAFTLWFDADTPRTAQRVTNELVASYLAENDRDRENRATIAESFLKTESLRLQGDVQRLDAAIERFKSEHAGYLPEDRAINTQLLDRVETQISELTRDARSLRNRQGLLRAQLAKTPRYLQVSGGVAAPSPDTQLAMLEGKLAAMRAKYGDSHPDVLALDRQISALKSAGAASRLDGAALALQIQSLAADLEIAKRQYGAKHPDVVKLERQLRALNTQLAAAPTSPAAAKSESNPDYTDIQIQLASIEMELDLTAGQLAAAEEKRGRIEDRILKAPNVEREYVGLRRDYDAAQQRYLEVKSKEGAAEMASNLESERVGETLTLAEPPVEPVEPIKPNRRIILAIGVVAAMAGAGLTGVLCDALDGRVHGWRQLAAITGQTPFATIPFIRTATDRRRSRAKGASIFVLAASSAAVTLVYVHYVLFPLDGLWAELMVRLGLTQWAGIAAPQAML